jgi:hypothetical protein
MEDLKRRTEEFKLSWGEWKDGARPSFAIPPILFVSADVITRSTFMGLMESLKNDGRLKGIILDEVHKFVTEAHFRRALTKIQKVTELGVPIHCFTATVKNGQENKITAALGLPPGSLRITRGVVDRPNLEYKVVRVSEKMGLRVHPVLLRVVQDIKALSPKMKKGELGLVITRSVETARQLAQQLDCSYFHAKRDQDSEEQLRQRFVDWQNERFKDVPTSAHSRWLMSTPIVDTGNDTRGVRYTFFAECPFDMVSFLQGSGRTARDILMGTVTIYFDKFDRGGLHKDMDVEFADVEGVKVFVETVDTCRRYMLTKQWDSRAVSCGGTPNAINCDYCASIASGVREFVAQDPTDGQTRTVQEISTAIEQSVEEARLDSQTLALLHSQYITSGTCPFCLMLSGTDARHPAVFCPTHKMHVTGYRSFRNQVTWQANVICWHCYFPHQCVDKRFHQEKDWETCKKQKIDLASDPSTKIFSQQSKSFISGLLYSIFVSEGLRKRVKEELNFGSVPRDYGAFCAYITNSVTHNSHRPLGLVLALRLLRSTLDKLQKQ